MRVLVLTGYIIFLVLFLCSGCETVPTEGKLSAATAVSAGPHFDYTVYGPADVEIMPLTRVEHGVNGQQQDRIKAFVSLIDRAGCQVKWPGVFRFELYRHVQRSAEPKGKRLVIWPDIGLIRSDKNNEYWRDFLRAYQFRLDFEPITENDYMLQVTFSAPEGGRLSTEIKLENTE